MIPLEGAICSQQYEKFTDMKLSQWYFDLS